jgi:mono/diheme cytochrome c family protein
MMLLALSACERGGGPVPPPDLESVEARERGRALFLEHCAICHGEHADGRGPRRGSLARPPANFRDPSWLERTDPQRTFGIVRDGVRGTPMAGWKATLDERALWDLVGYLHGVARGAGDGEP